MFHWVFSSFASRRALRLARKEILSLQARLATAEALLVQERARNRQREEALIDRILSVQQQPPLPKIAAPESPPPLSDSTPPTRPLTPHEQMLRENYALWAVEAGHTKEHGYRRFDREYQQSSH